MALRSSFLLSALFALGAISIALAMPSTNAFGGIIFEVEEVGSDLRITSSGALSLAGFSTTQSGGVWNAGLTYLRPRNVMTGSTNFDGYNSSATFFTEGGALTTAVFPSGPAFLGASTATGDYVALQLGGSQPLIYVPTGYTSGEPVSGSATYASQSLSSVGMTASTVWKWYLGADGDDSQSITVQAVPEPSSLALVGGLGGLLAGVVALTRPRRRQG